MLYKCSNSINKYKTRFINKNNKVIYQQAFVQKKSRQLAKRRDQHQYSPDWWHSQPIKAQHNCRLLHIPPPSGISRCLVVQTLWELSSHWLISLPPEASGLAPTWRDVAGGSTGNRTWWWSTYKTRVKDCHTSAKKYLFTLFQHFDDVLSYVPPPFFAVGTS